jgi:hypothetical protein
MVPVPAEFGQSTAPGIAAIQELLPDRDHPGHLPRCASGASSRSSGTPAQLREQRVIADRQTGTAAAQRTGDRHARDHRGRRVR